jgi:ubiquitin C-terminal hydrolase
MLVVYVVPLFLIHQVRLVSSASAVVGIPSPTLVSTGLKNLGNTCYMNAQLQCAFHIPAIRQRIFWEDDEMEVDADDIESTAPSPKKDAPKAESEALLALRQVFEDMARSATKKSMPVAPTSLCVRLGIPVMEQQDTQEFWKLLLPALKIESVSDLYKGSFEDYITALDGSERERRREELFLDLSLDVASR